MSVELQRAEDERDGTPGTKLIDCFAQQIELMMSGEGVWTRRGDARVRVRSSIKTKYITLNNKHDHKQSMIKHSPNFIVNSTSNI